MIGCLLWVVGMLTVQAQFAPRAGEPGSTAIHRDSLIITAWAKAAVLHRGPQQCGLPSLGHATTGTAESAIGPAGENGVVSLGDGGSIVLEFDPPIRNGSGFDFAVFENGFLYQDSLDFLELAFVEVSSDGVHFFRFPAVSLTQTLQQVDTFDGLDTRKIHNLAGKYTFGYGTPFDLSELPDTQLLDKAYIRYVRVVDVVGSLADSCGSEDAQGNRINDPWPTPFPQSGFDLDAIGVIHSEYPLAMDNGSEPALALSPNPVRRGEKIFRKVRGQNALLVLYDVQGKSWTLSGEWASGWELPPNLAPGVYQVQVGESFTRLWVLP